MKKAGVVLLFACTTLLCLSLKQPQTATSIGTQNCLQYFHQASLQFAATMAQLQQSIARLSTDSNTVIAARKQLADCRSSYKKIEFFTEYFFENRIKIFNAAPVYEIEEPYMEFQHPTGMQAMEVALFDEDVMSQKAELMAQAEVMHTTAENMMTYLHGREITDAEVLQAIRLELVRLYALGISGYDAPELKTGISETETAMQAVKQNLQPYLLHQQNATADSVAYYLNTCINQLSATNNFVAFNRLYFFTEAALPLQQYLGKLIGEMDAGKTRTGYLNENAPHLFSPAAIRKMGEGADERDSELVALGKRLFSEPLLSGNGLRSCATCHNPEKYFTDEQVKSIAFNGKDKVQRNAPSLLYAAYQHSQFLDGRAADLPSQLLAVLQSPVEMNASPKQVVKRLSVSAVYQHLFAKTFPATRPDSIITIERIAKAISSYEQSFTVMTSAFDQYVQGDKTALTASQQRGFNLFMGKAMCGTCHFAPLFNGLLPPAYDITEVESLGLTQTANFKKPVSDKDSGRYRFFPIEFYIGAFKTPTVRNAAVTAPYMHNGAFRTLQQVLDFYNRGGGNGMGLHNPHQTLSDKPLQLSPAEMKDIVHFLEALTDKPVNDYLKKKAAR